MQFYVFLVSELGPSDMFSSDALLGEIGSIVPYEAVDLRELGLVSSVPGRASSKLPTSVLAACHLLESAILLERAYLRANNPYWATDENLFALSCEALWVALQKHGFALEYNDGAEDAARALSAVFREQILLEKAEHYGLQEREYHPKEETPFADVLRQFVAKGGRTPSLTLFTGLAGANQFTPGAMKLVKQQLSRGVPVLISLRLSKAARLAELDATDALVASKSAAFVPCDSGAQDSAALIIGYTTVSGTPAWIIRGPFGPSWGDVGEFYLERNSNGFCAETRAFSALPAHWDTVWRAGPSAGSLQNPCGVGQLVYYSAGALSGFQCIMEELGCPGDARYIQNQVCVGTCASGYFQRRQASPFSVPRYFCTTPCGLWAASEASMRECVSACPRERPFVQLAECVEECAEDISPPATCAALRLCAAATAPFQTPDGRCTSGCPGGEFSEVHTGVLTCPRTRANCRYFVAEPRGKRCVEWCPVGYAYLGGRECRKGCAGVAEAGRGPLAVCANKCAGKLLLTSGTERCVEQCPQGYAAEDGNCVERCGSRMVILRAPGEWECVGRCEMLQEAGVGPGGSAVCRAECVRGAEFVWGSFCVPHCPDKFYWATEKRCARVGECGFYITTAAGKECVEACNATFSVENSGECMVSGQQCHTAFFWHEAAFPGDTGAGITHCVARCPLNAPLHSGTAVPPVQCLNACPLGQLYEDGLVCTERCPGGAYKLDGSKAVCAWPCTGFYIQNKGQTRCVPHCEAPYGEIRGSECLFTAFPKDGFWEVDGLVTARCASLIYEERDSGYNICRRETDCNAYESDNLPGARYRCVQSCGKRFQTGLLCVETCALYVLLSTQKQCVNDCGTTGKPFHGVEEPAQCLDACSGIWPFGLQGYECAKTCPNGLYTRSGSGELKCTPQCQKGAFKQENYAFPGQLECRAACGSAFKRRGLICVPQCQQALEVEQTCAQGCQSTLFELRRAYGDLRLCRPACEHQRFSQRFGASLCFQECLDAGFSAPCELAMRFYVNETSGRYVAIAGSCPWSYQFQLPQKDAQLDLYECVAACPAERPVYDDSHICHAFCESRTVRGALCVSECVATEFYMTVYYPVGALQIQSKLCLDDCPGLSLGQECVEYCGIGFYANTNGVCHAEKKLSQGQIAGIVISVLCGVLASCGLAFLLIWRRKSATSTSPKLN